MLLHHRFIEVAKKNPTKLAIIDRTRGTKVTYERALIGAMILAEKIKRYRPGFIGLMIPTSAGAALAQLGVLMSGRVPVIINYSTGAGKNCEYAQQRLNFDTILTSRALVEKINCPIVPGMVFLEDMMKEISVFDKIGTAMKAKMSAATIIKSIAGGDENDSFLILFTSGSEKDPKAVQLTHKNLRSNIESLSPYYGLNSDDIFLANLPYFHVFGQTANLWAPIYHGMTFITYANPLDFKTVCQIIREEKCTVVAGTPSFFWGYLQKADKGDFDSARVLLVGADKCPDALRKGFLEKQGKVLLEAYGTTETSPGISGNNLENNKPGSVGKPFPGVQLRIENYETGEACTQGEIGKVLVKGNNVMKGYFDDFEQTSLAIRHGWYDTGDMGWMDADGYLWHVGRLKRFMKVAGEMVSLVKVEDVMEKLLPEGTECCVVEIPDAVRGGKIAAATTQPVDEKEILKKMAMQLPNIALPKHFVVIPELPKMGSGKIDFRSTTNQVRDLLHGKN